MTNFYSKLIDFALNSGPRLIGYLIAAFLLNRILKLLTVRLVDLAATHTRVAQMREQQTRTLARILYRAGTVVIVTGAVLTALPEFNVNILPVATLVGVASVGLGFGAQHLVWDLISGFFIIFEDQFVIGDTIRVGNHLGRVEHMTLRRTVLRDVQGGLITIANGEMREVANMSREWSQVWVDVTVASDAAVDAALALLEKTAGEFRGDADWSGALVEGPRVLGVESLSLSGTALRIQVRTAPGRQDDVARELRRRIKTRFEEMRISLAGVQRVELVAPPRREQREPQA